MRLPHSRKMNAALVGTPLVVKAQTNKVAARRSLQVVASSAGPKKASIVPGPGFAPRGRFPRRGASSEQL